MSQHSGKRPSPLSRETGHVRTRPAEYNLPTSAKTGTPPFWHLTISFSCPSCSSSSKLQLPPHLSFLVVTSSPLRPRSVSLLSKLEAPQTLCVSPQLFAPSPLPST